MRLSLPDTPPAQEAVSVVERLRAAGHDAFLVGGCVRSLILGESPKDYDVATGARPEEVDALFEHTVPIGKAFGVMLVVEAGVETEVATFRADGEYIDHRRPTSVTFCGPEEDAKRRDFTVNALFMDPRTGEVIDHVGGLPDIEAKLIRCVGDPAKRFDEDALRLLRAVRFAARCGFEIERATWGAIRRLAPSIAEVSAERVGDEIVKMLTGPNPGNALRLLEASGLLDEVLPEVAAMRECPQPPEFHPEGDVLTHTCLCLDHLPPNPTPSLALGLLLHDVGKPPTLEFADRIRFNRHDRVGAEIAERICRRLRLSNALTEQVADHVANHMKFINARDMRVATLKRFVFQEDFDELCELHRCDSLGSMGEPTASDWCKRQRERFREEGVDRLPPPLITGKNLIDWGYEPGPIFREILEAVQTEQLEGGLTTAADAEVFVRERWPLATD